MTAASDRPTRLEIARAALASAERMVQEAKSPDAVMDRIGPLQDAQIELALAELADEDYRKRKEAELEAVLALWQHKP